MGLCLPALPHLPATHVANPSAAQHRGHLRGTAQGHAERAGHAAHGRGLRGGSIRPLLRGAHEASWGSSLRGGLQGDVAVVCHAPKHRSGLVVEPF